MTTPHESPVGANHHSPSTPRRQHAVRPAPLCGRALTALRQVPTMLSVLLETQKQRKKKPAMRDPILEEVRRVRKQAAISGDPGCLELRILAKNVFPFERSRECP